jgi:hypothetical protein
MLKVLRISSGVLPGRRTAAAAAAGRMHMVSMGKLMA